MVANRNPHVQRAVVKLRELSADERARDLFERREKALRDIDSRERYAHQKGRAEEQAIWQVIVADKDAKLADKDAEITRLREQLESKK